MPTCDLVRRSVQRLQPRRTGVHRWGVVVRPQRSGKAAAPRLHHGPRAAGRRAMRIAAALAVVISGASASLAGQASRPATREPQRRPPAALIAAGEAIAI